jgi:thiamine-monophosphate kinase
MKLSDAGELSLLEILRKRFGKKTKGVTLGIGDDSAVISPGVSQLLLTTDMMAEGVHFDLAWTTPFQLGFKLVSVNVSDIFAMGGKPQFLLPLLSSPVFLTASKQL